VAGSPAAAAPRTGIRFDRRISGALLDAVLGGPLKGLLDIRSSDPRLSDVELRADPWGAHCWISLSDVVFRFFVVRPPDPHGFDGNRDGVGCELP
jgi:hypothetical protein